ncbi:MAG: PAS domain S-box protein [Gemmataceae bacterium]
MKSTHQVRCGPERDTLASSLAERVKELVTLHQVARLFQRNLSTQELFEILVDLLPGGWQFPEQTAARIVFGSLDVRGKGYRRSPSIQEARFQTREGTSGLIEIVYLGDSRVDEGVFLREERDLLDSLTELLSLHLEYREGREAFEKSERRFRDLVEAAPDLIITVDAGGHITNLNPAFESLLRACRTNWLGQHFRGLLAEEDLPGAERLFVRTLAGENSSASEFHLRRSDGVLVPAEVTVAPLRGESGQAVGALAIVRDLTRRKELEAQFLQAQKMESYEQLAGGVAHDYNNLLTIISGYSEIALARLEPDHPLCALIREIRQAGERAAALTRQLLAFSQRQVFHLELLDVNAIVTDLQKMVRRLLGADIKLTTSLAADLPAIRADAGQIEQAIFNIVVNSREAMPDGGELIIETELTHFDELGGELPPGLRAGPSVKLSIRDTGHGMEPQVRARIFEPFFTTKAPGAASTGLGLAAVFGIVTQCGGHIDVASAPGKGTTFTLFFPAEATPGAESGTQLLPACSETVLVAEDDDNLRRFICELLEAQGFKVLAAADGQEALELSRQHAGNIDLLVSDVVMPALNGGKLAEQLEQQRPGLKTLFLSGYNDSVVVRQGLGLGHDRPFLAKPFQPRGLIRKVREILEAPSQAAASADA